MTKARVPTAVAAAVLATLTLTVFYVLQDYGPQSAVRRFYAAVATDNNAALQQVVDVRYDDPDVFYIKKFVLIFVAKGIQPQLARIDRQGDTVRVAVVYHLPNRETIAIVWIVDKKRHLWTINAALTAKALRDSLPPPS
jgi:hypothetical protein